MVLLMALLLGACLSSKALLVAPFNPLTLTLAMVALALIGLVIDRDLPSARRCLRHSPPGEKEET